MIRKVISSILLLLMLTNLSAFTVMAEDDITGSQYEQEARILAALDVMGGYQDGSFRPETEISRAEYADIVARLLLNSSADNAVEDAYFVDVQADYWAAPAIYMLAGMGIIKQTTRFKPEEAQTCYDAVRVLLNLLGYGEYASANGGYPGGYLSVAKTLRLLDGVTVTADDTGMTRGNIARMIYNALEVKFSYPDEIEVEETILSRKNIITANGTVCAVHNAAMNGYSNVRRDEVLIVSSSGERYLVKAGNTDAASMLGQRGRYYINEKEELLLYFGGAGSTGELYISAEEIEDIGDDYISYYLNNRIRKTAFSPSIIVIVNGERIDSGNPGDYMWPEVGGVRLARSSGSTKYDIAYVDSYEAYVADTAVAAEGKLVFKPGINKRGYVLTEDYAQVDITRNGAKASISDIQEWDVIHIAEKSGSQTITIDAVSTNISAGEIESIEDDKITVGGQEYSIDWRVAEAGLYPALKLAESAIFYYNMNGTIFAWKIDNAISGTYGYMKNLKITEDEMQVFSTMYTLDGEFINYEYDERVTVNGTRYKNIGLKYAADIYDGTAVVDQLVKFKIGTNGKIKTIETAQLMNGRVNNGYGYDDSKFTLVLKNDFNTSNFITIDHFNNGKFNNTYLANKDTKVLMIPQNLEMEDFAIMSVKEAFTSNSNYRDNKPLDIGEVMLYNADKFLNVPIIVCKTSKTNLYSESIDYNSDVMLIDKSMVAVNAENDIVHQISGLYKGKRVTYEVKENSNIDTDSIHRGMGVQISLNKDNLIVGMRVVFDIKDEDEFYVSSADNIVGRNETVGWNSNLLVYYGNVYDKMSDGSQIMINTGYAWDHYRGFLSNGMTVYKYNTATKKAENATYRDLICSRTNPQKVIFRAYRSLVKELIIIED